ncbi:hypothetical protein EGH10_20875 [Brevibacillus laterosporus]|uniref:PLAT domain-containing protein n=1 Tax=Brevibacillus laterosporus LMG 15441 TaxID=1042163 RepID=A0A075R6H9_BRELA|nr:hypothetical protein [Brevibacillus laterosporus]AIG27434.1 hypothetical protein BRLA_c031220 [Brevibacillus laterosporus LMG 15441]RJL15361.1 hypothetical protein DM460_00240 [Brevibacillus laterosporus]TPH06475.1 hypothetical protein EGH10_20875 [Brevibacillus laterosporus]
MSGYVTLAYVYFHSNDNDLNNKTPINVYLKKSDGIIIAQNAYEGGLSDHSDLGFDLYFTQPNIKREDLAGGTIVVTIDPHGEDTWKFNFQLLLYFSDNNYPDRYEWSGNELSEDNITKSFNLR